MKKLYVFALVASFTMLMGHKASGQIWLMVDGGGMLSKSSFTPTASFHGGYQFGYDLDQIAALGVTYGFKSPLTFDIPIIDTLGNIDSVESSVTSTLIMIDADWRKYLYQTEADDEFGFYTTVGISAWMVGSKVKLGDFNDSLFAPGTGVSLTSSNLSLHIPLGVGVDWTVRGLFWWYLEARMSLPITSVSNEYVGTDYGVGFHFTTGARIKLADL